MWFEPEVIGREGRMFDKELAQPRVQLFKQVAVWRPRDRLIVISRDNAIRKLLLDEAMQPFAGKDKLGFSHDAPPSLPFASTP